MLFATASLARRIERAESTLISDAAGAVARRTGSESVFLRHVGGGVAVHAGSGSPFTKVAGLGFQGLPDEAVFEEIEAEFAARDSPVQVELATLGYPAIGRTLTGRGYELVGYENVLGLALDGALREEAPGQGQAAAGAEIRRAQPAEHQEWLNAVLEGFLNPDSVEGPPSHESVDRQVLERVFDDMADAQGFEQYVGRLDGHMAAGASLRLFEGVAQLCGAATLPAFRRRGLQTALLRHRLAESARRGCDIAVVTTTPASKSQQNVQRAGFALLYARAILVKG